MRYALLLIALAAPMVAQDAPKQVAEPPAGVFEPIPPEDYDAYNRKANERYDAELKRVRAEFDAVMSKAPKKQKDRDKPTWLWKATMAEFRYNRGLRFARIELIRAWLPSTSEHRAEIDSLIRENVQDTQNLSALIRQAEGYYAATPPPLTQPRQSRRQSGQYTERSTVLPGGTIQTLTSDGRQCYTEKLPGGELYTHCY